MERLEKRIAEILVRFFISRNCVLHSNDCLDTFLWTNLYKKLIKLGFPLLYFTSYLCCLFCLQLNFVEFSRCRWETLSRLDRKKKKEATVEWSFPTNTRTAWRNCICPIFHKGLLRNMRFGSPLFCF